MGHYSIVHQCRNVVMWGGGCISVALAQPPVMVIGRDLSAHLMQLMFASAWGHEHRDTHSPDTHSAPLAPSVTTLSHSLSSTSLPLPCAPVFLPALLSLLHLLLPESHILIFSFKRVSNGQNSLVEIVEQLCVCGKWSNTTKECIQW